MPKFIVNMNYVEAKSTNFIIEAESEGDIHDVFGEENFEYPFFDENCKWITSQFEPPVIDNITMFTGKVPNKIICTKEQNDKIQKLFNKTIKQISIDEAN
jgi:hypothetical protein